MKLCYSYYKYILNNYAYLCPIMIFYGSNIYDSNSSDLDVCILVNNISEKEKKDIILQTIRYHEENELKLDEEIPYENKLIYTISEVKKILSTNPFKKGDKYFISDIKKDNEFLSSKEMKTRLLLNILTTDHLVIGKNINQIKEFEELAWKIILESIIGFNNLKKITVENILYLMYRNQYSGAEGEYYLGYKKNNINKEIYLKNKIQEYLEKYFY